MYISLNIRILLILRVVRWFLLIIPIITIFYRDHGLSMEQVFILQSCYALSVVLLEVPTGYFADRFGRKRSIILGILLGAVGYGLYSMSSTFWFFLLAEIILGIGSSFISGSDSAMIYDTLVLEGQTEHNKKIQGYFYSLAAISESVASLLGGFLAVISITLPFFIQFIIYALVIPLPFFLKENRVSMSDNIKHENFFSGIIKIIKYSLHGHTELRGIILFSGVFGASTLTMTWLLQPYMETLGIPVFYFGILWTIFNLSILPFSFFASKIENILGIKTSLLMIAIFPIIGYLFLSFTPTLFSLLFVFLFYFARGFSSVIFNDYVNNLISSDIRATVLSVQSFMYRLVFAIIGPIVGWIHDIYSIRTAFLFSAILFLVLFSLSIIPVLKRLSTNKS